jgi:hypothetical protein
MSVDKQIHEARRWLETAEEDAEFAIGIIESILTMIREILAATR